jgi:hypothetical protein
VPGELWLGGIHVARGYPGRPVMTAEKFLPDPFAAAAGGRLYRTGDLARWLAGGDLEFLGRIDQQVKVRGFRIELGEIESVLAEHPAVRAAAVAAPEVAGMKRLVAYVVTADPGDSSDDSMGDSMGSTLRAFLGERLPDYMIPSHFMTLDVLPLTATGKVDRRALPAPDGGAGRDEGFVAPRTPLEEAVAEIWSEVLGASRVGIHDSFWDLGGHSLLATKVLARLHEALGIDLPLQALFKSPTIAGLTVAIGEMLLAEDPDELEQLLAEMEEIPE